MDPFIRLERDPDLDSLALNMNKGPSLACFICGDADTASAPAFHLRRLYKDQVTLFKGLLLLPEMRGRMSPRLHSDFSSRLGTCAGCLPVLKQVWELHQELISIQKEIEKVLVRPREKLGNYCLKTNTTGPKAKRQLVPDVSAPPISPETNTGNDVDSEDEQEDEAHSMQEDEEKDFATEECASIKIEIDEHYSGPEDFEDLMDFAVQGCEQDNDDEEGTVTSGPEIKHGSPPRQSRRILSAPLKPSSSSKSSFKNESDEEFSHEDDDEEFESETLKQRNRVDLGGRERECCKCGQQFRRPYEVIFHEMSACGVVYTDAELRAMNYSSHRCKICSKLFRGARDLKRHSTVHTGATKTSACSKCGKSFTQPYYLVRHQAQHCSESEIDPEVKKRVHEESVAKYQKYSSKRCRHPGCTQRFGTEEKVDEHMAAAHKDGDPPVKAPPQICHLCGKTCYGSLSAHFRRVHAGVKRGTCSYCGKGFYSSTDLARHVAQIHEKGKRPGLGCDFCSKIFWDKANLNKHKARVHAMVRKHPCPAQNCSLTFYTTSDLKKHCARRHEAVLTPCRKCGRQFDSLGRLRRHEREVVDCDTDKKRGRVYTRRVPKKPASGEGEGDEISPETLA